MSTTMAKKLVQLGFAIILETIFFMIVPVPVVLRMLTGAVVAALLIRHWRRMDQPKPKVPDRPGPPVEWID